MTGLSQKLALMAAGTATFSLGSISAAKAATIDFEAGFSDLDPVGTVTASDGNEVTFSVGPGTTGGSSTAFITEIGAPVTALAPRDGRLTTIDSQIGNFFLSDENNGPLNSLNYFMEFADPITELSVDILDFRRDGGPTPIRTVTLTTFSDSFTTVVGSAVFDITRGLPNPNLETLRVDNPNGLIRSASIVYGVDSGTGIDNITFKTAPEPAAVVSLLALGALGAGTLLKRKQK